MVHASRSCNSIMGRRGGRTVPEHDQWRRAGIGGHRTVYHSELDQNKEVGTCYTMRAFRTTPTDWTTSPCRLSPSWSGSCMGPVLRISSLSDQKIQEQKWQLRPGSQQHLADRLTSGILLIDSQSAPLICLGRATRRRAGGKCADRRAHSIASERRKAYTRDHFEL